MSGLTHREKVDHLIAELEKQGISPSTAAPPLFRLLWALGLRVPPPLFLGFLSVTVLFGIFFGILWGALMWLLQWRFWHAPAMLLFGVSGGAGLLFGLSMAGYYRWKFARLQLPPWKNYPEPEPPPSY